MSEMTKKEFLENISKLAQMMVVAIEKGRRLGFLKLDNELLHFEVGLLSLNNIFEQEKYNDILYSEQLKEKE